MIEHIGELNRVLIATRSVADEARSARVEAVIAQCQTAVIEGRMPDHAVSIKFAASLGLVTCESDRVVITGKGVAFLECNIGDSYDLADEQKKLLLRGSFLQGPLRDRTRRLLKGFSPAFKAGTFRWSEVDSAPLDAEDWLIEQLRQLGLLKRDGGALEVEQLYVKTVAAFLEEGAGWSEEQAAEYYREKVEIGALAEDLIVKHEMDRLRGAGHPVEAECVRRISAVRVNAGYDIESYDAAAHDMDFDRFIEVKGSRGSDLRFIWTDNEMRIAKKYKDRYWIYFQGGIDLKKRAAKNEPMLFKNPIDTLHKDARLKMTPYGLVVEGKIRGAAR